MDRIKPNENLKEDTINKMKSILSRKDKKRLRIIPVTAFTLVIILVFSFFGKNIFNDKGNQISIAHGKDLMEDIKGERIDLIDKFPEGFLDKTRDLSMEMFKKISKEENGLYSPTPLYLALGLVSNGAEGETKGEILNILKDDKTSEEDLNVFYKSLMEDLSGKTKDLEVDIVNSIWYDEEFQADKSYLEKNKTFYDANAYRLDFRSSRAPETMNKWVREVTRDKIDKMVEEIGKDVVMYLFSSIYFNGKWENPFKGSRTYEGEFYMDKDKKIKADFMHKDEDILNIYNNDEEGILLPYKGGKYGFLALMPKEGVGINDYISKLTKDSLESKIKDMEESFVYLSLPIFEIEFGKSLVEDIKELGIEKAFDGNRAELYGMGSSSGNLYISDVAQKTYLKVDEEGTEAASVVKVEVSEESAPIGENIDFNRPFVYAIMDLENSLPIFIGVLNNPSN